MSLTYLYFFPIPKITKKYFKLGHTVCIFCALSKGLFIVESKTIL